MFTGHVFRQMIQWKVGMHASAFDLNKELRLFFSFHDPFEASDLPFPLNTGLLRPFTRRGVWANSEWFCYGTWSQVGHTSHSRPLPPPPSYYPQLCPSWFGYLVSSNNLWFKGLWEQTPSFSPALKAGHVSTLHAFCDEYCGSWEQWGDVAWGGMGNKAARVSDLALVLSEPESELALSGPVCFLNYVRPSPSDGLHNWFSQRQGGSSARILSSALLFASSICILMSKYLQWYFSSSFQKHLFFPLDFSIEKAAVYLKSKLFQYWQLCLFEFRLAIRWTIYLCLVLLLQHF